MANKLNIRRDDEVLVIAGSAKGYTGKVLSVNIAKKTVIVEGAKQITKATTPRQGVEGGLIKKDGPIHVSNVKLVSRPESK